MPINLHRTSKAGGPTSRYWRQDDPGFRFLVCAQVSAGIFARYSRNVGHGPVPFMCCHVLKVLEREHIPIHAIAGTSIGSIIGALYASGYSPDEIEKCPARLTGPTSD